MLKILGVVTLIPTGPNMEFREGCLGYPYQIYIYATEVVAKATF